MQLIYIYDALCGWCYGFSPVIKNFVEQHEGEFSVEVLSGGMVMGEREGPIGEVAGYIKNAYKQVEDRTGVKFGEGFLNNIMEPGTAIFSSWIPSLALTAFKSLKPNAALAYAHAAQHAIYHTGIAPKDKNAFASLGETLGVEKKRMLEAMESERIIKRTKEEFALVADFGVNGFPTVVMGHEQRLVVLSRGYIDAATLELNYGQAKTYFTQFAN